MKKLGILLCLGLFSLTGLAQVKMTFVVNEEAKSCRRMMEMTCLQIQKDGSKEWELFYEPIKGFNYVPGYRYVIEVIQTERPEPIPQDLSRYLYRLERIISQTPVFAKNEVTEYHIMRLNGNDVSKYEMFLGFDSTFTMIAGKSACNRFNLSAKFNGKKTKVKTTAGMATKMSCGDERDHLENEFLTSVGARKFKVSVENGMIIWKYKRKEVLAMIPEKQALPMDGSGSGKPERTAWNHFNQQMLRLIQMDGVVQQSSNATLMLDVDNKRFSGSNGCNKINGSLYASGNKIGFREVVSTKMACADELVANTERRIMEILSMKGLTVDFAENVLNIYDPEGKLVLMYAMAPEK